MACRTIYFEESLPIPPHPTGSAYSRSPLWNSVILWDWRDTPSHCTICPFEDLNRSILLASPSPQILGPGYYRSWRYMHLYYEFLMWYLAFCIGLFLTSFSGLVYVLLLGLLADQSYVFKTDNHTNLLNKQTGVNNCTIIKFELTLCMTTVLNSIMSKLACSSYY